MVMQYAVLKMMRTLVVGIKNKRALPSSRYVMSNRILTVEVSQGEF